MASPHTYVLSLIDPKCPELLPGGQQKRQPMFPPFGLTKGHFPASVSSSHLTWIHEGKLGNAFQVHG